MAAKDIRRAREVARRDRTVARDRARKAKRVNSVINYAELLEELKEMQK